MKIRDLTKGERLLVHRRRKEWSQRSAAYHYDVTLYRYRQWEADQEKDIPKISLGRLHEHEIYFLMRTRASIPLKQLAETLDVSRWWLTKMEYGKAPVARLGDYWKQNTKPWRPVLANA